MKLTNRLFIVSVFVLLAFSFTATAESPISQSPSHEVNEQLSESTFFNRILSFLGIGQEDEQDINASLTAKQSIEKSNDYYDNALSRLESNDTEAAIIQLNNAIKYNAKNIPAYILLGETHLKQGHAPFAEALFKRAIKQGAHNKTVIHQLAESYLAQHEYQKIIDKIPAAGLPHSLKIKIQLMWARAHFGLRQYNDAESIVDKILMLSPQHIAATLMKVQLEIAKNNLKSAESLLASIETAGEFDAEFWAYKGELAKEERHIDEAIKYYSKALSLNEAHLLSRHSRASLYIDKDQLAEGAKDVSAIRQLRPTDLYALLLEAVIHEKKR